MSANPSPSVIRSQRNNKRRPASLQPIELESHEESPHGLQPTDEVKAGLIGPGNLNLDSRGKLKLVKPKDHLGYFSTRHSILSNYIVMS